MLRIFMQMHIFSLISLFLINVIQFIIICLSTATSSVTETAQCRYCYHRIDINNYVTDRRKHKRNSHKARLGNSTVEKVLFTLYTIHNNMQVTGKRETLPINRKVVMRKPIIAIVIIPIN